MRKSYWMNVSLATDRDKEAVKSWFYPLVSDDMVPYEADILCDIATDCEKKIRARMTDADGKRHEFTLTKGHNFSISVKRIEAKP